jgi:hypothetical protein
MPIRKTKGGYRYGSQKVHKTKAGAVKQLRAIKASQARRTKRR